MIDWRGGGSPHQVENQRDEQHFEDGLCVCRGTDGRRRLGHSGGEGGKRRQRRERGNGGADEEVEEGEEEEDEEEEEKEELKVPEEVNL